MKYTFILFWGILDNKRYFRKQDLVDKYDRNISFELGELGVSTDIIKKNVSYLLNNELENITIIDYNLWNG